MSTLAALVQRRETTPRYPCRAEELSPPGTYRELKQSVIWMQLFEEVHNIFIQMAASFLDK